MTTTVTSPRDRRNDSFANTLVMALTVSLVCSVLVSTAVILLRPVQQQNQLLASGVESMLPIVEAMQLGIDPELLRDQLEVAVIDLRTGEIVEGADTSALPGDLMEEGTANRIRVPRDKDIAGIGEHSTQATVYLIREDAGLSYILLPVYGRGMWSTLYGFLALEADANTIAALKFYEHGETPGIGDKIDEPSWLAQWRGKLVYQDNTPKISVVKSRVPTTSPYEVDAITGATLTSVGISNLLRYWLGENGYQPYLENLRKAGEGQ